LGVLLKISIRDPKVFLFHFIWEIVTINANYYIFGSVMDKKPPIGRNDSRSA
jgi:hypothetical protein